jgi:hypothetical protein
MFYLYLSMNLHTGEEKKKMKEVQGGPLSQWPLK